jgi:hypothetical protein
MAGDAAGHLSTGRMMLSTDRLVLRRFRAEEAAAFASYHLDQGRLDQRPPRSAYSAT